MGRTFVFECPKCQYRAYVAGGADGGFHVAVQTILCQQCKELHDAVVRLRVPWTPPLQRGWPVQATLSRLTRQASSVPRHPPPFLQALNRLWPRGVRHSRWIEFPLLCPKGAWHSVRPWSRPDCCPKCGVIMEQNALPYRLWD
ncbi:hypothetical protein [Limisphaera sp. VF-2]|jgi:hypothetical protein|uniref:hypothetical protein n=1 Tax=Limisphaera sp. VF-2 TaxID=3400418 RepID=UPI0017507B22|nr:hypothetical protein [Limisphaera sp.]